MSFRRSHKPPGRCNTPSRGCSIEGFAARAERGVAIVNTVVLIPIFLVIAVVVFDLARLYLNAIFAQEMVLLISKIASSQHPDGFALADNQLVQLSRIPSGEEEEVTNLRYAFWAAEVDPSNARYHGKTYFSDKEKKVLNLAYGFAHKLNPRMYFPIPEPLSDETALKLQFTVSCSIYFRYAAGHEPPDSLPAEGDPTYSSVMNEDRDRIFHVDCAVPLIGMALVGFSLGSPYRIVSRTAYAYRSGNIVP